MDAYESIIKEIIRSQMAIIGPIAIEEANKTFCIQVNKSLDSIKIQTDPQIALQKLVEQYALLFGEISIEVSRDATKRVIDKQKLEVSLPDSIK